MKIRTLAPVALLSVLGVLCMAVNDCEGNPVVVGSTDSGIDAGDGGTLRQIYGSVDCQKRGACVIQSGAQFSQTECTTNNQQEGERADSVGCTAEYDSFLACAAGITYDCTQPTNLQITASCGTLNDALTTCVSQ